MAELQIIINSQLTDLNPVVAGRCHVEPGHVTGLSMISYILIHYVISGTCTYVLAGHSYTVREGDCFITLPGQNAARINHPDIPLDMKWIGFTGKLSHDFTALPPVFSVGDDPFPHIKTLQEPPPMLAVALAGDLFHLYYSHVGPRQKKQDYVEYISEFVRTHYMEKLSVEAFAKEFGIDRRHMSAQFKKKTGYSVQEFITKIRIDEAMSFLSQGYSGKEVAKLCGFTDSHNFYKTFKKAQGLRPSAWKERNVMLEQKYRSEEP